MKEASKTNLLKESYMNGSVLDIGCGDDLCVPHAIPFDEEQGDANNILKYFKPETFDCVFSSHCLEHMDDPKKCISDWWALVKKGGVLCIIVPEENLYEQGHWPSLFSPYHKSTFSLGTKSNWSPVSYDLLKLMSDLPGVKIISSEIQDRNYIHQKPLIKLPGMSKIFKMFWEDLFHAGRADSFLGHILVRIALACSCPIDQTLSSAMAQIKIVARK
jgi:SAM-dependent methyltransferase